MDGWCCVRAMRLSRLFLLRRDTRFVAGGETVAPADLKINMRVFVRGGKDVFGHVEAYQVVWGGI